ncbi:MAG TPA: 50S ribosomal protein L10 [Thermoplasmata archaeon]|nr:50S ribosomal protein L10 [Thermoplasmata archaeon]
MAATSHPNPAKAAEVETLVARMKDASVVGIVSVQGIPARQFQAMRRRLRDKAEIRVAKNSLVRLALERAGGDKKGLTDLAANLAGQTAVVTTKLNPFRLFKELEGTKTVAPARGGEVAPEEIWVRAGETPFKPGPIVGELQKAGIPAAIEKGKVLIKKDKLLVKAGERIPREVASVLTRLEIYPLIVGLDLRGAYEAGQVYGRDVLAVDDVKVRAQVTDAIRGALNLSVFVEYPTGFTIPFLITKAFREALGLAMEAGFPTKETAKFLLAKAQAQALALAARFPAALGGESTKES